MPVTYDPDEDLRHETMRHDDEVRRQRLQEEEVETEMGTFSARANRNLLGRVFIFVAMVLAAGMFVHLYLHPVADMLGSVAESLRSTVRK